MAIHKRKAKWDNFVQKMEELRDEVQEQEELKPLQSGRKTPSE